MDYTRPIIPGGSFTWSEYALLQEWNAYARPTEQQRYNAVVLFKEIQKLRAELGKPMVIRSGARTDQYTAYLRSRGIPAALKSAHNDWCAVDLAVPNMRTVDLWRFCDQRWLGRLENFTHTPTWVHLDTRNWGRRERFNP
jgi:uncharacterized protein YcbK (DUF882 family)